MTSPMPFFAGMCCICFYPISPGEYARDETGEWDAHKGKCAQEAGIKELE